MDDTMLANAAKRRLESKPLLTITIAAGGPEGLRLRWFGRDRRGRVRGGLDA